MAAIGAGWADGSFLEGSFASGAWESAANESPTNITLSSSTVSTTAGTNALVGLLTVTDPDSGDSHTLTLVAGTGDTDNASFSISGNQLLCDDPAALGESSRSVLVQADDGVSTPFTKVFNIDVVVSGGSGYGFTGLFNSTFLRFYT